MKQKLIIDKKSVSQQIIDHIIQEIIDGRLKLGDRILNEREFAEQLGVSRVPVREAISALSLLGILTPRQGEGTFVTEFDTERFSKIIFANVKLQNISQKDIFYVRKDFECSAAKYAAQSATKEDIEIIKHNYILHKNAIEEYLTGKCDFGLVIQADMQFHDAIASAANNVFFKQFVDALHYSIRYFHKVYKHKRDAIKKFPAEHKIILEAIEERNPDLAYQRMLEHLNFNINI
ncbi:MAG: FadR/GntR family transcriptional regulator [Saccharofermentanales bacterium]|jgi:GntR family transcriptional repressor for pyruvate dehydrogenase complex